MKRLLLLIALCSQLHAQRILAPILAGVPASSGGQTIAQVATSPTAAGSGVSTSAIDTTGATLLLAYIGSFGATISCPTDSKGNTWTLVGTEGVLSNSHGRWCYSVPGTVGSGHTFTNPAIAFAGGCYMAFSGTAASPLDSTALATSTNHGVTVTISSVTPASSGSLVVSAVSNNNSGTYVNDNATMSAQGQQTSSSNETVSCWSVIQTSILAVNPTIGNGSDDYAGNTATFKHGP